MSHKVVPLPRCHSVILLHKEGSLSYSLFSSFSIIEPDFLTLYVFRERYTRPAPYTFLCL